jgi:hypothetical protein
MMEKMIKILEGRFGKPGKGENAIKKEWKWKEFRNLKRMKWDSIKTEGEEWRIIHKNERNEMRKYKIER